MKYLRVKSKHNLFTVEDAFSYKGPVETYKNKSVRGNRYKVR